jgi:hypothetical protein
MEGWAFGVCCYAGCTQRIAYRTTKEAHPVYCPMHCEMIQERLKKMFPRSATKEVLYWAVHRMNGKGQRMTKQVTLR